jgi:hypothetical protein
MKMPRRPEEPDGPTSTQAHPEKPVLPVPALMLADLATASPNLSPAVGAHHAEAAAVCFDRCGHDSPVDVRVSGTPLFRGVSVEFGVVTDAMRRTHADLEEATEAGACGVAILLIKAASRRLVVERSRKGTGFDYWLGPPDGPLLQKKARMEVSGILRGNDALVAARVRLKHEQTRRSDGLRIPAYVVVVEFGGPRAVVEERR